ncbi:carotenoid 1,2-hydratase [Vibrio europaeus]|uniref:ABC transporter n=1 Tax=Vibrio europaeus TaxID=300876 RepID=A0A178JF37_9VIBR|nr:lipocalin-like domain-containing protein [Vibrio europaeus]MDC5707302.1 carotenoid 1,2-hydratase [Vibrio europaeus]MDC5712667.1 carotenoid 1,2-hydratase [Vibrio europaeus]MDC5717310.1 carotenoid 1,2-hydratase [Vibrio europaeus]MDC5721156.1 carotenoid 1,2-hydratase [Vibrio europaeus]MDC5726610.1 carotenoid 1,2-hydratase [Vibrio europaeus]
MSSRSKRILGVFIITLILSAFALVALYEQGAGNKIAARTNEVSSVLVSKPTQVFEPVLPDNPVVIPRDFAFHNEYQHGWWHFFANVEDQYGEKYGIQWSYFRIASNDSNMLGWLSPQLFISHVVVSNKDKVWREQRVARGGIGQAGMTSKPFRIWIDNWFWRSLGRTPFPGLLDAQTDTFKVRLKTTTRGPFVIPRERGYVVKHDLLPIASHNLTAPFLAVEGRLELAPDRVIDVKGTGWMSKEWGSGLLAEDQQGWDWFVFHLDDETTLSINRYRHDSQLPYVFGTLATNDGKVVTLYNEDIEVVPLQEEVLANGKIIPTSWMINIPRLSVSLETQVMNNNLWLPFVLPYWEGPITTTGSHNAQGFMQLTGY